MQKLKFINSLVDRAILENQTYFLTDTGIAGEVNIPWIKEGEQLCVDGTLPTFIGMVSAFDNPEVEIKDNKAIITEGDERAEFNGTSIDLINRNKQPVDPKNIVNNIKNLNGCEDVATVDLTEATIKKFKKVAPLIDNETFNLSFDGKLKLSILNNYFKDSWFTELECDSKEPFDLSFHKSAIAQLPIGDAKLTVYKGAKGGYRMSIESQDVYLVATPIKQ